jgi:hypothetical protein
VVRKPALRTEYKVELDGFGQPAMVVYLSRELGVADRPGQVVVINLRRDAGQSDIDQVPTGL